MTQHSHKYIPKGIVPSETATCTPMFTDTLLTIASRRKPPLMFIKTDEWVNQMWYMSIQ